MTDMAAGRKTGAGGPTVMPSAAVYDPELTLSTPRRVSAETGMNALAHCIEAAWSPTRSPEAEVLALAGVARIGAALPEVVEHPGDLEVRSRMLVGAVLGGRSLQNAPMGAHHGLSQLVGGRTGIPHGLANAVLLAHVMRFNAQAVPAEMARVAEALGAPGDGGGEAAAAVVDGLRQRLGLPGRLSECGVGEDDLDAVARLAEGNRNVAANPRRVGPEEARSILEAAF